MSDSQPDSGEAAAAPSLRLAHYSLGLLFLVNVFSQVDRQIMNILVEPVRKDLGLSDSEIGLLVGIAFAFFYTVAGLPLARIADRGNRRNLISIALAIWSMMTVACGLARNFGELFVARIAVGVGEAGCAPSAQSLIGDYFPADRRGRALSTYQLGVPAGILLGMAFGGMIADALGWRQAFFVIGLPGLIFAVFTRFTLREPPRGTLDQGVDTSLDSVRDVFRFLWSMPTLRHVMIAASLQTLVLSAHVTFNASFLQRIHDMSLTQAGLTLGIVSGLTGGFGTYAGGWLGDRFASRDPRWAIWWLMIGAAVSIPFSTLAYLANDANLAVVALALSLLGSYMYAGAVHAIPQSLAKPRMRAMTAAIILFSMNLFGYGGGPWLVGMLSDLLGGEEAIRYALVLMNFGLVWACIHYALAARTYRTDLAAKRID